MTVAAAEGFAVLAAEVGRRRTFAIISHPDAGKTTLTEKFLLYGGAVAEAGSVRARKNARRATSDWMAMERERGISITSTVLQFDALDRRFNLLDTPGHQDFSEDTYRTLMAVDSAVMVLDASRGIEPQTLKLFAVCRQRRIPILTFVNKMDLPAREPLDLLDEVERVLGIKAVPFNWPIGDGPSFQGVFDLRTHEVHRYARTEGGRHRAAVTVSSIADPELGRVIGEAEQAQLQEEVEMLAALVPPYDQAAFEQGEMTPVFFGSARDNFGVEPFLAALAELAPPPAGRESDAGRIAPEAGDFSGFVFKIQANMDPQHRDAMAFVRVCSGRFEKDMAVWVPRLKRSVKLTRPHRLFARERETVEEAYAGDVVGLVNPGLFAIGDTLCGGAKFNFPPLPRFRPEAFAILENRDVGRLKQFQKGLKQLEEEGAVHIFWRADTGRAEPVLAAVGQLQFDVVIARLAGEYGADATLRPLAHTEIRVVAGPAGAISEASWPRDCVLAHDRDGELVALFNSDTAADFWQRQNPKLDFRPWA